MTQTLAEWNSLKLKKFLRSIFYGCHNMLQKSFSNCSGFCPLFFLGSVSKILCHGEVPLAKIQDTFRVSNPTVLLTQVDMGLDTHLSDQINLITIQTKKLRNPSYIQGCLIFMQVFSNLSDFVAATLEFVDQSKSHQELAP